MATKPGLTAFTHATDANIGSGPAAGFPTKVVVPSPAQGFIPGLGVSAQQVNIVLNEIGTWLNDWVSKGSFAADADAHIVETGPGGAIAVLLASIGTPTLGALGLDVHNLSNIFEALNVENHDPDGAGAFITAGGTGLTVTAGDTAVRATSGPGSPVASFFKTAGAPTRGALHTETQNDPSGHTEGDFHITPSFPGVGQAGRSTFVRSDQTDGGTQFLRAWDTNKGYYFRSKQSTAISITSLNEGSAVNKLTLSVDPKAGGKYKATFSCAIATLTGTDTVIGIKLDTGVVGRDKVYKIRITTIQQWQTFHATWMLDGNAALMDLTIDFFSVDGSNDVQISDAEIIFEGSHDEIN